MSLQDLIAPYLNRFVILFSENATAKLELSCAEGKVHVNMFYDLVAPKQNLPTAPPVKKAGYSDSLKKNLKTSQLNRLKRRAAVRAEEAETQTVRQNQMAEKAVEEAAKAVHAPEQHNVEAAKKNIEVQAANGEAKEAEAEKGPCDWDYAVTEKLWLLQIQITGKKTYCFQIYLLQGTLWKKARISRITKKKIGLKQPSVSYVETSLTAWR